MPRVVQTAAKAAARLTQGDGSYGSSMGRQEGWVAGDIPAAWEGDEGGKGRQATGRRWLRRRQGLCRMKASAKRMRPADVHVRGDRAC